MLTHVDLFSGIGGFSLAARWLNLETIAQVEIDEYCQEKLIKNFPNVPKYRDIADFEPVACDVLTAGLPCQPFSLAGKQLGTADPRYLWHETLRVIVEAKPKLVILENVRGLLTNDKGNTFRGILQDLAVNGYDAEWYIIPATAVGAIHRRDRLWVIATDTQGNRREESWYNDMQAGTDFTSVSEATSVRVSGKLSEQRYCRQDDGLSRRLARVNQEVPCKPLSRQGLYLHYDSALNGERTVANRNAIKAYGNAIVPQIAYAVLAYGLQRQLP